MGPGTQAEEETTPTFPNQGEPGTGPGQLDQEPQHQAEKGMQPIPGRKEDNEPESDPVDQANQNKSSDDLSSDD